LRILAVAGIVLWAFSISCGGEDGAPAKVAGEADAGGSRLADQLEYRVTQAELALAKEKLPYLVLDMEKREIAIRLGGATVWKYPMKFATEDTLEIDDFVRLFRGSDDRLLRPVTERYLFEALDQTPDSVLNIVGEALKIDPGLMQREVPERFRVIWSGNLVLEVRTEVQGQPVSKFRNALVEIGSIFHRPFGLAKIALQMEPKAAITLYRASTPGLPTLIYPSHRTIP
jgi:hypothetical protein